MSFIDNLTGNLHISSLTLIIGWLVIINLIAFVSMGIDKRKARHDAWRTPESVLFLQAAAGGSVGSLLGMFVFHHKTRKRRFLIGMPLILAAQIALAAAVALNAQEIIFL